jgi:lipopolysaccharide transport system permease protein
MGDLALNMRSGVDDLALGLEKHRVWRALASENIGDQHRRTTLGPMWLLVNYLIYLFTFLMIFSGTQKISEFTAYVATGLLVWFYLSEMITQATTLFTREEAYINGTTLPLSVYVLRLTAQALVRSAYALLGCVIVLLLTETPITPMWIWSLAGLAVIAATTPAVIILVAVLGAYFPDSQFVVPNLMRVGLFLTPIFWTHASGARGILYKWNPLTYYLEIVRKPITDGEFPHYALLACIAAGIVLWVIAIAVLGAVRKRIVFVL